MNRLNTALLLLVGLVLLVVGGGGVLLQTNAIEWATPADVRDWWFDINWSRSLLWLVAFGAALVSLMFARLLVGSFASRRRGDSLHLVGPDGSTTLSAATMTRALERDLRAIPEIRWARTDRLENGGDRVQLGLQLGADIDKSSLPEAGGAAALRAAQVLGRMLDREVVVTARMRIGEPTINNKRSVK